MTSDVARVAIVAGAAGALGRATSLALSDSGFTVVAVDPGTTWGQQRIIKIR